MAHGTFGWEKFAARSYKSRLESNDGRRVTAQMRTSGPERDWLYITARNQTNPLSITVLVLGPTGLLLGQATSGDGQAAHDQARSAARTAAGLD